MDYSPTMVVPFQHINNAKGCGIHFAGEKHTHDATLSLLNYQIRGLIDERGSQLRYYRSDSQPGRLENMTET